MCLVQDKSLKVRMEHAVVSHLAFRIPVPPDPASYPDLETPSGKPFHVLPEGFAQRLQGGFLSLQAPAEGSSPGIVYFIVNCRDGGAEVNGLLTCRCAFLLLFSCEVSGAAHTCLLYTSPSPRDRTRSRMPSSA